MLQKLSLQSHLGAAHQLAPAHHYLALGGQLEARTRVRRGRYPSGSPLRRHAQEHAVAAFRERDGLPGGDIVISDPPPLSVSSPSPSMPQRATMNSHFVISPNAMPISPPVPESTIVSVRN